MLGMKSTVTFDTSILSPFTVSIEEPTTSILLWSAAAKFMTEWQKKVMNLSLLYLLDSKEKGAQIRETRPNNICGKSRKIFPIRNKHKECVHKVEDHTAVDHTCEEHSYRPKGPGI